MELRDQYYALLLDFFPLVERVGTENKALGEQLHRTALDALLVVQSTRADNDSFSLFYTKVFARRLEELDVLLRLTHDLGLLEPDVLVFLQKRIVQLQEN